MRCGFMQKIDAKIYKCTYKQMGSLAHRNGNDENNSFQRNSILFNESVLLIFTSWQTLYYIYVQISSAAYMLNVCIQKSHH